jgi:hypothetical protein
MILGAVTSNKPKWGDTNLELYKEHGHYHVRAFDADSKRLFWESFDRM